MIGTAKGTYIKGVTAAEVMKPTAFTKPCAEWMTKIRDRRRWRNRGSKLQIKTSPMWIGRVICLHKGKGNEFVYTEVECASGRRSMNQMLQAYVIIPYTNTSSFGLLRLQKTPQRRVESVVGTSKSPIFVTSFALS